MKSDENVLGKGIEAIFQKTAHLKAGEAKTLELPNGTIMREGSELVIRLQLDEYQDIRAAVEELAEASKAGMLDQLVDESKVKSKLQEHVELAFIAWDDKDYQSSMDEFKAVLKINNHPNVRFNLALLYEYMGKTDTAIKQYMKVIKLSPKHVEALTNIGILYNKKGNLTKAMDYYQKAVSIDSKIADKGKAGDLFPPRYERRKVKF